VAPGSEVTLAAATAFLAGVVDAIAGGGGLLTLPVLLATGLPPHAALGTNKGQAVFGAVASFATFWRKKGIDRERAGVGFLLGFVGSALGALLVLAIRPEPLKPVVMVLLVLAAGVVLARGYVKATPRTLAHPLRAAALVALGFGAYDGFFGPGVGSLLIVAFTVVFGDGLTRASGNAKVVNLASNLAAFLIFAWRGLVLWEVALPMALARAVGASIGARLALSRGDRFVRVVVLLVVCALVVKLGVDMARR
jgi:uncharacterized membrane protein YfcA